MGLRVDGKLLRVLLLIGLTLQLIPREALATNTDTLRDYLLIVRPKHRPESRQLLQGLAGYFNEQKIAELAQVFEAHATDNSHGTGWVYRTEDGATYIITNRHVIGAAGSAIVIKEVLDSRGEPQRSPALEARIVYVDEVSDIAVLRADLPRQQGALKLATTRPNGGAVVWAAGFPGLGGGELWQATQGNITNSAALLTASGFRLLQHSATIDPGNSGGPLLIETGPKFEVVGVNTWKANNRTNVNFSISADEVRAVLAKATNGEATERDTSALKSDLEARSAAFARELSKPQPSLDAILGYVSYLYVSRWGFDSFVAELNDSRTPDAQREEMSMRIREDPLQEMRVSAGVQLVRGVQRITATPGVRHLGIVNEHASLVGQREEIVTMLDIAGQQVPVAWTREHGHWRVSDSNLADTSIGPPVDVVPPPPPQPPEGDTPPIERAGGEGGLRRQTDGAVFVPKVGLVAFGGFSGEGSNTCEGDLTGYCTDLAFENTDLAGGFVLGADLLFHPGSNFRLGPEVLFYPSVTDRVDGAKYDNGQELDALLIGEFVADIGPSFAFLLRGGLGIGVLMPGGDLEDDLQLLIDDCPNTGYTSCEIDRGPFTGLTWGIGGGFLLPFESGALRFEMVYSSFTFNSQTRYEVDDGTLLGAYSTDVDTTIDRTVLMAGFDL